MWEKRVGNSYLFEPALVNNRKHLRFWVRNAIIYKMLTGKAHHSLGAGSGEWRATWCLKDPQGCIPKPLIRVEGAALEDKWEWCTMLPCFHSGQLKNLIIIDQGMRELRQVAENNCLLKWKSLLSMRFKSLWKKSSISKGLLSFHKC